MNPVNNLILNENAYTVITIIELMLQSKHEIQEECVILDYLKIEINLLKEKEEYVIQIANSDLWKDEYFDNVSKIKNEFDDKIIFKIENKLHFENETCTENQVNSQSNVEMKFEGEKFLCIELKPKLNSGQLEEFQDLVLNKIEASKKLYSNVKFKFSRDSIILHNDDVEFEKDEEICYFVSFALINIVKQSQRKEFKRKIFNIFNVNNYDELNYSINSCLLSQIYGNDKNVINQSSYFDEKEN